MLTAARQTSLSQDAWASVTELNNAPCDAPLLRETSWLSPVLQHELNKEKALPRFAVVSQRWKTRSDVACASAAAALAVSRGETPTVFRVQ